MASLDELKALCNPAPGGAPSPQPRPVREKLPFRAEVDSEFRDRQRLPIPCRTATSEFRRSREEFGLEPAQMGLTAPSADRPVASADEEDEASDGRELSPEASSEARPVFDAESPLVEGDEEQARQEAETAARLRAADELQDRQAAAVAEQKMLYDAAVNLRIRLEPSINTARRIVSPDPGSLVDISEEVSATSASFEAIASILDKASLSFVRKKSSSELHSDPDADAEQNLEADELKEDAQQFDEWRDGVLDFWATRVDSISLHASIGRVGMNKSGVPAAPGTMAFKAIDTRPSTQIRSILLSGKHLERSRKQKCTLVAIGADTHEMVGSHPRNYDDGELYRALLREVIDNGDAPGGGLRYAQLARSGRVRKNFDRRASKGRKLSLAVHDKLVGFLAPVPLPHPGPVDVLIAGLFGGSGR